MAGVFHAVLIAVLYCGASLLGAQLEATAAAKEHADKAAVYAQSGDFQRAEVELRIAVELAPADSSYLTSLGGVLGMQQKLKEAKVYLERAVKASPADAVARRNLAANQWQLHLFKEAQANLDQLLQVDPHDQSALLLGGMVAENLHEYARAARLLALVPDLVRGRPESIAALASAYYHTSQWDKAHTLLEGLLDRPAQPQGIFAAAGVAVRARDYGIAQNLLESIRATYPDTPALEYNLALIAYRSGRVGESQAKLTDLVRAGRATADVYELFVTTLVTTAKLPAALQAASQMVDALPASERAFRAKGMVEMKMNQFTDAVRSYTRAVELDSSSLDAKTGLASAQWAAGMRAEAGVAFQSLIRNNPRDAAVHEAYGTLLLESAIDEAGEAQGAALLKTAIKLDASRVEAHYQLGNLALQRGQTEDARKYLETAARLEPRQSRIPFALARLYRRLGRAHSAAKAMQLYEKLKAEETGAAVRESSVRMQPR